MYSVYRSLKRGARVTWLDSPHGAEDDDDRPRTLPRQFYRNGGSAAAAGLRHSETLPRTGARRRLQRQSALDMLATGWPDSVGLEDDLHHASTPPTRPISRRRSCYRGEQDM